MSLSLYNSYQNGSQAWWAMKEAIQAESDLDEAVSTAARVMDNIIQEFNDACEQRDNAEEERDQALRDLEEAEGKLEVFNPEEIIKQLNDIEFAAVAVVKYCMKTRMDIQEAYNVPKSSPDSSNGNNSDGGSETTDSSDQTSPQG